MKNINIGILSFAVIAMAGMAFPALAEQRGNVLIAVNSISGKQGIADKQNTLDDENENEATSSEKENTSTSSNKENENEKNDNASTSIESELHRSIVANSVQNLLSIADREGGIGEEIRVIAREQNDSSTSTVEAIRNVENRGFIKTLAFGDDYKNLGIIRNGLATTTNQIERLKVIASNTTNPDDKSALLAEIKVLEDNQIAINKFVKDHEDSFSFLGWFFKMFSK